MLVSQHTRVRKTCVPRPKRIWKRKYRRRRGCLKEDPPGITLPPRASPLPNRPPTLHPSAKAIDSLIYAYLNNWTRSGLANEIPIIPTPSAASLPFIYIRGTGEPKRTVLPFFNDNYQRWSPLHPTITITPDNNNGGARLTRLLIINAIENNNGGRALLIRFIRGKLARQSAFRGRVRFRRGDFIDSRRHAFRFVSFLSLSLFKHLAFLWIGEQITQLVGRPPMRMYIYTQSRF